MAKAEPKTTDTPKVTLEEAVVALYNVVAAADQYQREAQLAVCRGVMRDLLDRDPKELIEPKIELQELVPTATVAGSAAEAVKPVPAES